MGIVKLKIEKIYPKDIIAIFTLLFCFTLMALGINKVVSGIVIMIITYYFSKRIYEEKHPENDVNGKLEKIEEEIKQIPKTSKIPSSTPRQTGNYKVINIKENITPSI